MNEMDEKRLGIRRSDLLHEIEIVWLQPPADFDYVRQGMTFSSKRQGRLRRSGCIVVGYADLAWHTPSSIKRRQTFQRRIFWIENWDRALAPNGRYANDFPCEAVDPNTVFVGVPGSHTPRSMGGKFFVPFDSPDAVLRRKIAAEAARVDRVKRE